MVQKEARCKIAIAAGFGQFSLRMFLLCLAISSLLRLNLFTFVISLFRDCVLGEFYITLSSRIAALPFSDQVGVAST